MRHDLNNVLITELLIIKYRLYYLESILDKNDSDDWPDGYYEDILETTDRFYRTKNKLLKIFKESEIDYILLKLEKSGGVC